MTYHIDIANKQHIPKHLALSKKFKYSKVTIVFFWYKHLSKKKVSMKSSRTVKKNFGI